jgi:hypothetical protein
LTTPPPLMPLISILWVRWYFFIGRLPNEMRVLDLNAFDATRELDLQYVSLIGELLSSKTIGEGGIVGMTSSEWLERWKEYKATFLK